MGRQRAAVCHATPWRRRLSTRTQTVVAVGLGNMGAPLAGRIAAKFPTSVFDMDAAAAERHAAEFDTVALTGAEQLREAVASADVVVTCLPNTDATLATVDAVRSSLKAGACVSHFDLAHSLPHAKLINNCGEQAPSGSTPHLASPQTQQL